jgi:hypothetical protein
LRVDHGTEVKRPPVEVGWRWRQTRRFPDQASLEAIGLGEM